MIVNGNLTVGGRVSADSLLFTELASLSEMSTGINIYLINGRLYYKIDADTTFMFYSQEEIDSYISELQTEIDNVSNTSGGSTSSSTVNTSNTYSSINAASDTALMNLLNTTFFPIIDDSVVHLTNLNFDTTTDKLKATFLFDKIQLSTYKNGKIGKLEYQASPTYYLNTYVNEDIIPLFKCYKFENYALSSIDQTKLNELYLKDLFEYDNLDITNVLNALIKDTSDTSILYLNSTNILYTSFFTFNQMNFKLDVGDLRAYMTEIHKKAFNSEPIFYFFNNYVSLYNYENVTRVRYYFFDYRFFIQYQCVNMIDYIKNVYNDISDYTNQLSSTIQTQKSDNSYDVTTLFPYDYTSFQFDVSICEILSAMFDVDVSFRSKIAQEDLSVQINVYKQHITSLNNSLLTDMDFSDSQSFNYNGEETIYPIIDKININDGEFQVPVIEFDAPLDSYFYFMV